MGAVAEPAVHARWSRSYPPLALLAIAVLIAAFILPSSLNLPQSNPSTVLEYAPVPPEDDEPPPVTGNLSSLGLGSSNTLGVGGQPPPPPPPKTRTEGKRPEYKRCIAGKQTEDPAAPPCVSFFEGDNFGATYQGVTAEEITVLVYFDVGAPNYEYTPSGGTYVDVDQDPKPHCGKKWPSGDTERGKCDDLWLRITRAFNIYFNNRFQTYGRHVHYIVHYTEASQAATRRSDAQEDWSRFHPFAVVDRATFNGYNDAYEDALASRGVLTFTSETALANSYFTKNAPMSWAFWQDVEHWAKIYTSYVCSKIVTANSFRAGSPDLNGRARKLGLWYTTDQSEPGLRLFAQYVEAGVRQCGGNIVAKADYTDSGFIVDGQNPGVEATDAVAKFKQNDVTTVLYLGGLEGRLSQAMDQAKYYPEIVVAGDLDNDNNNTGRLQNQQAWKQAFGVSLQIRFGKPEETAGYRAYKEVDPSGQPDEARLINDAYRDHFMLFQAIQVAGPDLTPEAVDKGFHAIPKNKSSSPDVPAFYFDPDDYSMVKDGTEFWWDPAGPSPGNAQPGCIRLVNQGARYQPGQWPAGNSTFRPDDFCSGFEGGQPIRA